jgi:hypothetical protein
VKDGIDRHKTRRMSGLRSSNFSSAHPKKGPRSWPSEMAKKTSEKPANHCQPLPFLWNSYLKLCFGLASQPSRHPNNSVSEPSRNVTPTIPRRAKIDYFFAAEIRVKCY